MAPTYFLHDGNGEEEEEEEEMPVTPGLTEAAPGHDGPGVAGGDALQHCGLVHGESQVLRAHKDHGVLVHGGVGACKDSTMVRRLLIPSWLKGTSRTSGIL